MFNVLLDKETIVTTAATATTATTTATTATINSKSTIDIKCRASKTS
jgi:hypothetical protein